MKTFLSTIIARRLRAATLAAALGLTVLAGFGGVGVAHAAPTGFSIVPGNQQTTAGQGITVSTWTANQPSTQFAQLLPTYTWGDGQQSIITAEELGPTAPQTQLIGAHTWQQPGTYQVTVSYATAQKLAFSTRFTVTVDPAPVVAPQPQQVPGPAGSGFLTVPAAFTTTAGQPVTYRAVTKLLADRNIDARLTWDDGQSSVATQQQVKRGDQPYTQLTADHTYAEPGTYQVTITYVAAAGRAFGVSFIVNVTPSGVG